MASAGRLSRRERELSLRKEIILEAAEEVFADKGYYEAAVEEIASRAEISVGTLYNLFANKEALYLTLIEQRVDGFIAHVTHRAETGRSAVEKLDHLLEGIFEYLERHQAFFRLYVMTTHGLPWHVNSDMGAVLFAKYKEMVSFVTAICQQGKEEGVFHTEAPFSLALAILGVVNAFLTSWIMGKKKRPLSDSLVEVRSHVRRLTGGNNRRASG
ncbi:MAG: TetR/AcrR family transcriptional regulator [Deltaproteobacteria bacterium]|nr:TetR/AcrR family transcriptional regulator [Deltaproteobacteria bacterium]